MPAYNDWFYISSGGSADTDWPGLHSGMASLLLLDHVWATLAAEADMSYLSTCTRGHIYILQTPLSVPTRNISGNTPFSPAPRYYQSPTEVACVCLATK